MCYSAECWALYDGYVKEFGADIDIKAFWELYLGRDEKYRIRHKLSDGTKIPKGVDLNFRQPRSDLERKIQDLIGEWNGRKLAESEAELAAQEARLAAAEAKLAVKETKTALNEQRIAGNKIKQMTRWIEDAKRTSHQPTKDDRIFPDWYAPVLIVENGRRIVRPMRYHCRPAGMDPASDRMKDGKISGKYNARRDNLTRFWRKQFGHSHGLMLAETFYENVDDGNPSGGAAPSTHGLAGCAGSSSNDSPPEAASTFVSLNHHWQTPPRNRRPVMGWWVSSIGSTRHPGTRCERTSFLPSWLRQRTAPGSV